MKQETEKEIEKELDTIERMIEKNMNNSRLDDMRDKNLFKKHDSLYHLRTHFMTLYMLMSKKVDIFDKNYGQYGDALEELDFILLLEICMRNNRKMFNIDEKLWGIFEETKNRIYYRELPFDINFINRIIEVEKDIFCYGITIEKRINNEKNEAIHISLHGWNFSDETDWNMSFSIDKNNKIWASNIEIFGEVSVKDFRGRIFTIVCNFLDFLNHPEVEMRKESWFNNKKRIEKGKFIVPDKINIKIKGKLYRYVYEENRSSNRTSKNSFWVRSHFVHFWNKKRYNKLYSLEENILQRKGYYTDNQGVISKFRQRYIKGSGELKEKEYKLKTQKV